MYVHGLTIHNLRAFDRFEMQFDRPVPAGTETTYAGLNVFVGGNASGKSTLLKCLAMVLSGPMVAGQQIMRTDGWLRHGSRRGTVEARLHYEPGVDQFRSGGAPPGQEFAARLLVEAGTDGGPSLRSLEYRTARGSRVQSAARGPWHASARGWFLAAYGPLRRLTGSSTDALRYSLGGGKLASCVSLFREDAALSESEVWLKQQHARGLEAKANGRTDGDLSESVTRLLNGGLLPNGFTVSHVTVDDVFMNTPNGGELPLRDLSDGCRSVYALILDIIHSMVDAYRDEDIFGTDAEGRTVVTKPGVVLIDELEAHLHPEWQRSACDWLRTRFPRVQFFVTTHSPLVVQAADPGGVYVLPLPNELAAGRTARRLNPHEQERVTLGKAEKVLLGEAFGLSNTWSVRAQDLVKRWERLAAMEAQGLPLSTNEREDLGCLNGQMELVFDDNLPGTPRA